VSGLLGRIGVKLSLTGFALRYGSVMGKLGAKSFLFRPFRIDGPEGIELGAGSSLQRGGWLYCVAQDGGKARLAIGSGCILGYNNHITAVREVIIGDHVLTANNVYVSDNVHEFEDISRPIMHQPVIFKGHVSIGDGAWLGENVCIIGASVGRNCVIGANAVVTHDIPDYCVAVGIPAVVIRRFDTASKKWVAVSQRKTATENTK
jgi:acetyltransferase-like isoleucine patch superfamily enzyme